MKSNHVGGLKRSLQKTNDSKINKREKDRKMGSFYVSVKLPTYLSPKPTLTLSSYLGQNFGLGEG